MVSCAYCGGSHARVADVRACWERNEGVEAPVDAPVEGGAEGGLAADDGLREPAPAAATVERTSHSGHPVRPVLGRSVLVRPGQAAPDGWGACDRVAGDDLPRLEEAWRERTPLVIEVAADPRTDEVERRPVWSLDPSFAFPGERLAHALFANAADARSGTPTWPLADVARRLGAAIGGPADVVLPDGEPAFCDGGPITHPDALREFGGLGDLGGAVVVPRAALLAGSLRPFGSNATDAALAADQLAAVTHPGGAARIIAPAGSGKTRVLTERARHLLRRWNVPGSAMTLLAFNKRAADEMVERTTDLPELQVRTLNALGLSLVRRASSRVSTIEERDVRSILDSLVDLPRKANTDPAAAWIDALSRVRLGLADPRRVEAEFGGDVDGLPEVFDRYRRILADRAAVDFDEQIYRAIEILLTDAHARRSARAAFRLTLVDEFQDLTPAHLLLIRLLSGPEGAVFGVGDDDQTIYSYSGASPEWLIEYREYFPTAGEHPLQVNYRCPAPVVDAARTLLTHNQRRVQKTIVAAPGRVDGDRPLTVVRDGEPLTGTVDAVDESVRAGVAPSDIAVLARVNAVLAPVQVALVQRGVPVRAAVDESYLTRGGVQAALAWLRLAVSDPQHLTGADIAHAARRPSRALSPRVVEWMGEQRSVRDLSRLAGRVTGRDQEKIETFATDVRIVQSVAASGSTASVLRAVRDRIGLDRAMELLEGSRRRLERSAQTDDLDALVALAALHPEPAGFEPWLRTALRNPGQSDGVTLATVHSVKGREWPRVVVHDVSERLFPHRLATDVEEERRVFHVALTRCSSAVTLVAGEEASPFLGELFEEWTPRTPPVRRAPEPATAGRVTRPNGPAAAAREERVAVAAVGLELEQGGHRGVVRSVDEEGVLVEVGRARMRISFGSMVRVDGREARLVPVPPAADVVERARAGLRAWRAQLAKKTAKPAYVIFSDATLEAIVTAMPSSLVALSRIKGIGPAKLEAYGDDVLAIVEAARGE